MKNPPTQHVRHKCKIQEIAYTCRHIYCTIMDCMIIASLWTFFSLQFVQAQLQDSSCDNLIYCLWHFATRVLGKCL